MVSTEHPGRAHGPIEPPDVTLAYLAWAPFGPAMVEQFLGAYRQRPAGYPHRLMVILNGYRDDAARAATLRLFADVAHEPLVMAKPVQDLAAYRAAARAATTRFLCFVNSYSTPLADGWLAKLAAHARRPDVGLVGATGSWESLFAPLAYARGHPEPFPRVLRPRKWAGWIRRARHWAPRVAWTELHFRPFPNPHIRTNTFMLDRNVFLSLAPGPLRTKQDAYRFENGRLSLTEQVRALGLATLVVGRDGVAYPPDAWMNSHTYFRGDQENLLVADNQTRLYTNGDAAQRRDMSIRAWGVP